MALTAFLKIPDILGEARTAGHAGEIDIHGMSWTIRQDNNANVAQGRRRERAKADRLIMTKFTDASSVYLALASLQGKRFDEVVLAVRKDSGEAHLDYLVITMSNCVIVSFEMDNDGSHPVDGLITERVGVMFEKVTMKYTVQAADHSAGAEHEITYDIAAGV